MTDGPSEPVVVSPQQHSHTVDSQRASGRPFTTSVSMSEPMQAKEQKVSFALYYSACLFGCQSYRFFCLVARSNDGASGS
jgi:hypothetical protein